MMEKTELPFESVHELLKCDPKAIALFLLINSLGGYNFWGWG